MGRVQIYDFHFPGEPNIYSMINYSLTIYIITKLHVNKYQFGLIYIYIYFYALKVVYEAVRLANIVPVMFRKSLQDSEVGGMFY